MHTEDEPAKAATVDAVLEVADEIGVPAAQVAVAWLLERARRSTTALVPVIGPRTVEQIDSYLASLDWSDRRRSSTCASIRSAVSGWGRRSNQLASAGHRAVGWRCCRLRTRRRFPRRLTPSREPSLERDAVTAVERTHHFYRFSLRCPASAGSAAASASPSSTRAARPRGGRQRRLDALDSPSRTPRPVARIAAYSDVVGSNVVGEVGEAAPR